MGELLGLHTNVTDDQEAWAREEQSDVPMQGAARKPDFAKLCRGTARMAQIQRQYTEEAPRLIQARQANSHGRACSR